MDISRRALRYPALSTLITLFSCLDESWTRQRVWGAMQAFAGVFVLVMPGRVMSYQSACATLFDWAGFRFDWSSTPDPSGFQRARTRVTVADTQRVWTGVSGWAQRHLKPGRELVPGRIIVGIDGTTLHVPRSRSTIRAYTLIKDILGTGLSHYPQAMLISAWDVVKRVPITWELTSLKVGERRGLLRMLLRLPEKAVLALDRGYPGREVLGEIVASGRDFVVRMVSAKAGSWNVVADFIASGKRSAIVEITLGKGKKKRTVRVRLILRTFAVGRPKRTQRRESMVVMTSLTDPAISDATILKIYAARWGVETLYRELKSLAHIEGWHGTTKALLEQEMIAIMCWFAVTAVIAQAAEGDAVTPDGSYRRVNTRRVFDAISSIMESLFIASAPPGDIAEWFNTRANEAIRRIERWKKKTRAGRSASRKPLHPYARKIVKKLNG
jgi:hypothetical protein